MLGLVYALIAATDPVVEPLPTADERPPIELRAPPPVLEGRENDGTLKRGPPSLSVPHQAVERRKSPLFASLETGLLFVGGAIWYWDRTWYSAESRWDLHFDPTSWSKKLDLSAIRFDTDRFNTSAVDHPRAGIAYYQAARGNGFGFAASYAWVFMTEVLWAYLVEWDEFPSLNDMIMTPQSGAVVGESLFRFGEFLNWSAPTVPNRLGALLFSPFAAVNDLANGRSPEREGPFDDNGFTRRVRHRFAIAFDAVASELDGKRGDLASIGVAGVT
jgi:hypothetical protein